MRRLRLLLPAMLLLGSVTAATQLAGAAPTAEGKQWRELYETTGLTWAQIASVCPTDGATACSGTIGGRNLTGWIWATAGQVRGLMDDYAPALADPAIPAVTGIEGFWAGVTFLEDMRWTTYQSSTYSYYEFTGGWTASRDANGLPISGSASYSHQLAGSTAAGSLGFGSGADGAGPYIGVFLWRPADLDYTPPIVTPSIDGTLGTNGWYRSDVSVSWTVSDPESPIVSTEGCTPSVLSVDTSGTSFTCTAVSAGAGGPGSATVTIARDATPPTVTCGPAPTFAYTQFPAYVTATVTDGMSGASVASLTALASTSSVGTGTVTLTGSDRAGNQSSATCSYTVAAPTCKGKAVTILGTGGNDTIVGTSREDVIHGAGGADTIDGAGGNDVICGGDNSDVIQGAKGADVVDGGPGNDDIYGGDGNDDLDGGDHSDSIRGDAGADRCTSGELRMSSCAVIY